MFRNRYVPTSPVFKAFHIKEQELQQTSRLQTSADLGSPSAVFHHSSPSSILTGPPPKQEELAKARGRVLCCLQVGPS